MTTKIAFTLPAEAVEGASEAILLGDFNNWNPERGFRLERQSDGSFKAVAQLEEGHTYHYRFLLNDGRWVNDYNAQSYVSIPGLYIDNCVITVPAASEAEENNIVGTSKAVTTSKKAIKAAINAKAESAKTVTTKKTAPKTKAVDKNIQSKTVEKTEKVAKKAAPKAKK